MTGCTRMVAAAAMAASLAAVPARANHEGSPTDGNWLGVGVGHGGDLIDVKYLDAVVAETLKLGPKFTRQGIDNVGGATKGAAFNWAARDQAVQAFLGAGVEPKAVVSFRDLVQRGKRLSTWKANWTYFVRNVFAHYKGKLRYYIIDNEPDLDSTVSARVAKDMTCIAFNEARATDPAIRIQSPPTSSAGSTYLRDMLNLGVTRCAHVVGVHSYGGQLDDAHGDSIGTTWRFQAAANRYYGHPIRPVAISEAGNSYTWAPAGVDPRVWEARWHKLAHVQYKRWGVEWLNVFSLRSPSGYWDVAAWDGSKFVPNTLVYEAVLKGFKQMPFANGGFEEPNDRDYEWVVVYRLAQPNPVEWSRVSFPLADPEQAHGGGGYVAMTAPAQVRRVVPATPGQQLTVTAWANVAGGTASLKALGYARLDGAAEATSSTGATGGA
jgi:hypothetical protein